MTLLLNPQIGHPLIIEKVNLNSDQEIKLNFLFVSNKAENELVQVLSNSMRFFPIIQYSWKLSREIEERSLWKRIKNFWEKVGKLFTFKKPSKEKEIEIREYDKWGNESTTIEKISKKDIPSLEQRPFRSEPIYPKNFEVKSVNPITIDNISYLQDIYCTPLKYFNRVNQIKGLKNFYKVSFNLKIKLEILDFLKDYNYLMFDIHYADEYENKKINFHSLVVTKNDWKNFNVVQATDLHVAERNDHMLKKIEEAYEKNLQELSERKIQQNLETLHKRIVNPNDLLRCFINEMNQKVLKNKLDLIFLTGDLVDFTISSIKSTEQSDNYEYDDSNWKIFKEIILDIYEPPSQEVLNPEELLCPIFTIPGNHDYKPWQYDLSWFGMYKKVGLKKIEAEALKEEYSVSPIRAILKSQSALDAYFLEINPSLDFYLKLGNLLFIFLNSGADSYMQLGDYVTGSPSLTGITERQVSFLKNVLNTQLEKNGQAILSLHGPPINTPLKRGILTRLEKIFRKEKRTELEEFKESNFKSSKDYYQLARIDDKFNIQYGTISSNWDFVFNTCYYNCILTLSGHTHILNEYRLQSMNETENLVAVFYDDFADIFRSSTKIKKNGPFVVQTPALGFKSYKKPGKVAGYRLIKFKKGELSSFQVKYTRISQYKRKKIDYNKAA
jgi:predicted MPP superfamily phosphohydrolase